MILLFDIATALLGLRVSSCPSSLVLTLLLKRCFFAFAAQLTPEFVAQKISASIISFIFFLFSSLFSTAITSLDHITILITQCRTVKI